MTKVLGHYTSQEGLIGMLQNQVIWATNIKYLNDEHEFLHAIELIRGILPSSKITKESSDHDIYADYRTRIEKELKSLDSYHTEHIYTFSVSTESDLLSQWRGYCPSNNGYCVSLDIEKVFKSIKTDSLKSHLVECVYDISVKEKALKDVLNKRWFEFRQAKDKKAKATVIRSFSRDIALLASYFKHPSFSEEKEWRIVLILDYAGDEDIKFRPGKSSIIPYIELDLDKAAIKEIKIGPTANKILSERSLALLLEIVYGNPFSMPKITETGIPYRSW